MRALMVGAQAPRKPSVAERERKPDHVVRIQQIVRRRAHVELGEYGTSDPQLNPVTRNSSVRPEERKLIRDADGGDVRRQVGFISSLVAGEGAGCLWVGDKRAEDVAARQRQVTASLGGRAGHAA